MPKLLGNQICYHVEKKHNDLQYKITAPNGKSYIGQNVMSVKTRFQLRGDRIGMSLSVYGLKSRMKQHQKKRSNCTLLKRSILKYGWENMKVEVLLYCEEKHLNFYEKQMILAWDTLAPRGLNCTSGGEAGKRLSMETRGKIASGMKKAHAEGRAFSLDWTVVNIRKNLNRKSVRITEDTQKNLDNAGLQMQMVLFP